MKIKIYSELTEQQKREFFDTLKKIKKSNDPAAVNMWADDWHQQKHTLPYKLEKTDMFNKNNGEFFLVYDDEKFVGCCGVYKSLFSEHIALAGTRTWVEEEYRNKLVSRDILLPANKKWAIDHGCKQIALCFNDYNKVLIVGWKRIRAGLTKNVRSPRRPEHLCYDNFNEVTHPVTIQYTKQWVIYEKLDKDWDFDWKSIEFTK